MNGIGLFSALSDEVRVTSEKIYDIVRNVKAGRMAKAEAVEEIKTLRSELQELAEIFKKRLPLFQISTSEPEEGLLISCAQYLAIHDPKSAEVLLKEAPHIAPAVDWKLARAENEMLRALREKDYSKVLSLFQKQGREAVFPYERDLMELLEVLSRKSSVKQGDNDELEDYEKGLINKEHIDLALKVLFENSPIVTKRDPPDPDKVLNRFRAMNEYTGGNDLAAMVSLALSAVKTADCGNPLAKNPDCPACMPNFKEYIQTIPCADKSTSNLDEDLLLLPSGVCINREKLKKYTEEKGQNPKWCFVDPGDPSDRSSWQSAQRIYTP